MNGLVIYLRANEHIANMRRDAERERFAAQFAKHESFVVRVVAQLRRERPIGDRPPARPNDAQPATTVSDAAAAEA